MLFIARLLQTKNLEKNYVKRNKRCSDIRCANSCWNHLVVDHEALIIAI